MHNKLAWKRAHALASAHGHAWACLRPVPSSQEEAEALWASVTPEELGPCGGLGPAVHHTTGTGRLRWWVGPLGSVILTVARPSPAGDVLAARVNEEGIVVVTALGEAHLRHWVCLSLALRALGLRLPEGKARKLVEASEEAWKAYAHVYAHDPEEALEVLENAQRFDASAEKILAEEWEIIAAARAAVARSARLTRALGGDQ